MLLLWSRPYTVLQISTLFSASEVSSPNTPRGGYLKHTCKASVALGIKTRHPNSACEAPYGVVLPTLLPLHSSSQLPECLLTLPQGFCTGCFLCQECFLGLVHCFRPYASSYPEGSGQQHHREAPAATLPPGLAQGPFLSFPSSLALSWSWSPQADWGLPIPGHPAVGVGGSQ